MCTYRFFSLLWWVDYSARLLINLILLRDHPYIMSAKGLGGISKMAIFANVQYFSCWRRVGGWVRKTPKMCWLNIRMVPKWKNFVRCLQFQGGGTKILQISLIFQATTERIPGSATVLCLISFPLWWHYQVIMFSLTSVEFWWLYLW